MSPTFPSIVIAVDGTAASGKGTLAKKLAAHFGFAHLDSGALYRLAALSVLETGGDPASEADALKGAQTMDFNRAGDPKIRTDIVGKAASQVAAIRAVREALLDFQRNFLAHPPGGSPGAVMDGRDIGTVICPTAAAKLYIDAGLEVRARRRWAELKAMGIRRAEQDVVQELASRDQADKNRPVSPLKQAPDADLLDTTDLGIDAAFAAALALVSPRIESALKDRQRG
ncbi:MAG TPA: (d)CMP kinase [Rhizomicrobium sp.]|jgi:cytidylate kinase|nr:(d)CMP kinase [Rhizomicrobium sp.]